MAISADLHGYPDFSVTIDKKALNTYDDLMSNKLAAAGSEDLTKDTDIRVFRVRGEVHIQCTDPGKLPPVVGILNVTGQAVGTFPLEKIRENIITPSLSDGLYFFLFRMNSGNLIKKVPFND
jgi:hypothetical protein